jgi:hypothetical protein
MKPGHKFVATSRPTYAPPFSWNCEDGGPEGADMDDNKGKSTAFIKEVSMMLDGIEGLKLSWCEVLPFHGGKFGGWVSENENYLGLSRVLR